MMKDAGELNILRNGAKKFGVDLTDDQLLLYEQYTRELLSWNEKVNLTTITNEKDVITKHYLDSLSVMPKIPVCMPKLLDIGTGGGFPGIPLKIARPDIQLTLMDSIRKKTDFLVHMSSVLDLKFNVWCLRAEDGGKEGSLREQFDIVISRAVAKMSVLAEYCLPFVAIGGYFIAMKSESVDQEVSDAYNAIKTLGGGESVIEKVVIPETDIIRSLVLIRKVCSTPDKYPRRAGQPEKKPLF